MKKFLKVGSIVMCLSAYGCAQSPEQPPAVPSVYVPAVASNPGEHCELIANEIASLDSGLGGPVVDGPPLAPATAGARWGSYGKNLVLQTIMGPFQPVIQTVNAASNREDKQRLAADRVDRAALRRAYLRGLYEGGNCHAAVVVPELAEDAG
ncbi:MAG: hypothetical protein WBN34_07230 [Woeseia sp.]